MAKLEITNLKVSYSRLSTQPPILNIPSLKVEDGRIVTFLGPNHAGKSTLLKVVAGALRDMHVSRNSVLYDGRSLDEFGRTNIGYLPQRFGETLFPWLSLGKNLRLRLLARSVETEATEEQVQGLCRALDFDSEESLFRHFGFCQNGTIKRPLELSGGQQQILALLRTLLPTAKMLVLDEPFSAIDIYKGAALRRSFLEFVEKNHITTLIVTHNPVEAVDLADRIVMLRRDDTRGSTVGTTYEVGEPGKPGGNLTEDEAKALVKRIKRENAMG